MTRPGGACVGTHGEEMAAELADDRYRDRVGDYVELEEPDTDLDDIPF